MALCSHMSLPVVSSPVYCVVNHGRITYSSNVNFGWACYFISYYVQINFYNSNEVISLKRVIFDEIVNIYLLVTAILWRSCRSDVILKVWSTVKIRGTRVPQQAIVPVGRPRPYSIMILNMRFIPKASLRASSQITASSYILERHL